jgi:hypothetical protein
MLSSSILPLHELQKHPLRPAETKNFVLPGAPSLAHLLFLRQGWETLLTPDLLKMVSPNRKSLPAGAVVCIRQKDL